MKDQKSKIKAAAPEQIVQAAMFIQGTQRELNEIKFHVDGITDESGEDKETVITRIIQHGLNITTEKITIQNQVFPVHPEVFNLIELISRERDTYKRAIESVGGND